MARNVGRGQPCTQVNANVAASNRIEVQHRRRRSRSSRTQMAIPCRTLKKSAPGIR